MKKRKIAVFTASRSEFGLLTPVMEAIEKHPKLDLEIIATGMHMLEKFGYSIKLVTNKFKNVTSFKILEEDSGKATPEGMSYCTLETSKALEIIRPDIYLFLGDRSEAFATVIAPLMLGIPIAHIHGGDRSRAGLDESFRHALTKISNIHFPATKKSAERILKMGEEPYRIFTVGSPSLDKILSNMLEPVEELYDKYGLNKEKTLALLVQHPVTTQVEKARDQIRETLEAVRESGLETVIIYPNYDPGNEAIREEIEKLRGQPRFYIYKNLPHRTYLTMLKTSSVLIGNSSSGIIDASALKVPSVNIGIRQDGRERGENVIDVEHDKNKIKEAINKALYDEDFKQRVKKSESPYGDGTAGKKIAEVLSKIEINEALMQKQITY